MDFAKFGLILGLSRSYASPRIGLCQSKKISLVAFLGVQMDSASACACPVPCSGMLQGFRETVSKREIQPDLIHLECCPQCPGYVAAITAVTVWFLEVQGISTQATFSYRNFRALFGQCCSLLFSGAIQCNFSLLRQCCGH